MFLIERIFAVVSRLFPLLAFPLILTTVPASALTKEAAIENCRMSVGRPIVMACMRGGGNSFEGCREKARPQVVACVMAALNAANGRANVAVAIPTEAAPKLSPGTALPTGFIAPPRTISDITAILDTEKPDPAVIEKSKATANAVPTGKESRAELSQFYFDRSTARSQLGRLADAITDANKAIEVGRGVIDAFTMGRNTQLLALDYFYAGDLKQSLDIYLRMLRETDVHGAKGYAFSTNRQISNVLAQMGDVPQAEAYLRRSQALIQQARTSGLPGWRDSYQKFGQNWEAEVEFNRALIFEARGQFREAEASYRMMEQRKRAGMQAVLALENAPTQSVILQSINAAVAGEARMKARLGRLAEAEVDARRALLSRLQDTGKYNPATSRYVMNLADVLVEEGRYGEAEQLTRVAVDINRAVGIADDSQAIVTPLAHLAGILRLEHKNEEANAIFNQIDAAVAKWEPQRRQAFELNPSRILSLYSSGQVEAGIGAAERLVKRQVQRVGENHFDTASAHGTLAIGLMRAGRDGDAIREFKAAIPIMLANAQENADDEDTTLVAARSLRLQTIVESYFTLLARAQGATDAVGEETFGLADSVRGHSVQQALAASSARAAAKDPVLAELVRKEQDLTNRSTPSSAL
jgi:tetratricopeptide (TPR) repeat protein